MSRPRLRRPSTPVLVTVALLLVPVVEFMVTVRVARLLGAGVVLLLLVAGLVAGFTVLRRVGVRALARLAAGPNRYPATAGAPTLTDELLGAATGLLLMFPGLVTDVLGLLLVIPAVRTAAGERLTAAWRSALLKPGSAWAPTAPGGPFLNPDHGAPHPAGSDSVIIGEVVDARDVPSPHPTAPPRD